LPKGQVFQEQIAARAEESSEENNQEPQQAQHTASLTREQAKIDEQLIHLIRKSRSVFWRGTGKAVLYCGSAFVSAPKIRTSDPNLRKLLNVRSLRLSRSPRVRPTFVITCALIGRR
jgi:hypothetical protein